MGKISFPKGGNPRSKAILRGRGFPALPEYKNAWFRCKKRVLCKNIFFNFGVKRFPHGRGLESYFVPGHSFALRDLCAVCQKKKKQKKKKNKKTKKRVPLAGKKNGCRNALHLDSGLAGPDSKRAGSTFTKTSMTITTGPGPGPLHVFETRPRGSQRAKKIPSRGCAPRPATGEGTKTLGMGRLSDGRLLI